ASPPIEWIDGIPQGELVGRSAFEMILPEDLPRATLFFQEMLQHPGRSATFDARFHGPRGMHWIETAVTNLLEDPYVRGFVINGRDITDRKRMEEALQESEEKYRELVETFPDTVLIHRNGRMEYINPAGLALFGAKSPDAIIGRSIGDLIHPDYHATIRESVAKDMRGEPSSILELLALRLDGTTVPVEGRGRRIVYQGEPALQAIIRDITDRKQAEKALSESRQYIQAVAQGSPIPTFVMDRDHAVTVWNRALEDYTGIMADEMLGKSMAWKAFYQKQRPLLTDLLIDDAIDQIPHWYEGKCSKSMHSLGAYEVTEFFPQLKGGRWMFFTAAPIRNEN
ncbi:MAG TPA: PAS domain S-box protein, partial [Methanomicrobiales archaeon]|nr:PAS domain S-box protein [Methanomicrobiales archaeon]